MVAPGYFATLGLRLREGRFLDDRDALDAPLAMVVNRRFAAVVALAASAIPARRAAGTTGSGITSGLSDVSRARTLRPGHPYSPTTA